ncbi:MAG TPA: hypothetical protein DCP92_02085 [Nitrospiraceae bacterium]|jgi:DNA-binding Xre family transcriptional regulator|nr:hypothetical protein [Nitrospiraceae bacterium]
MKTRREDDRVLYWNLQQLLYDRNIRRPQDFRDMLVEHGLEMSYPACYALFHEQPVRVTMKVIQTILKMLDCTPNDLFVLRTPGGKPTKGGPSNVADTRAKKEKVVPLTPHQKKITGGRLEF